MVLPVGRLNYDGFDRQPAGLPAGGLRSKLPSGKRSAAGLGMAALGGEVAPTRPMRSIAPPPVERPARHRSQPPSQFSSDAAPHDPDGQRGMPSIPRSGRCCLPPLALFCPWISLEDAPCVRVAAPPWSFAATAIGATVTAPLLCRSGTTHRRPCRRLPLSGESARPSCPCRTPAPVSGQTEESDASGFPPLASSVPLQFEPTEPVIPAPWSCCRCHRPLPDRVRLDFLRYRIRRNRPHRSTHGPHPRN